jgi:hypothetical protein
LAAVVGRAPRRGEGRAVRAHRVAVQAAVADLLPADGQVEGQEAGRRRCAAAALRLGGEGLLGTALDGQPDGAADVLLADQVLHVDLSLPLLVLEDRLERSERRPEFREP